MVRAEDLKMQSRLDAHDEQIQKLQKGVQEVKQTLDLEISKQEAFRALVQDFIKKRSKKPVMEEGFVEESFTDSAKGKKPEAGKGEKYQIVVPEKVAEAKKGLIEVAGAKESEEANIKKATESHDEGVEKMKEEGAEAEIDGLFQNSNEKSHGENTVENGRNEAAGVNVGEEGKEEMEEEVAETDGRHSGIFLGFGSLSFCLVGFGYHWNIGSGKNFPTSKNHRNDDGAIFDNEQSLSGACLLPHLGAQSLHLWRCGIVLERMGPTKHVASLKMGL